MRGLESTPRQLALPVEGPSRIDRMWGSFSPAAQERILRLLARRSRASWTRRRSNDEQQVERQHLERKAYVYVRQSTMAQVERNVESRERQYELVERAVALGWSRRRWSWSTATRPLGEEHRRARRVPATGRRGRARQSRDRARDRGLAAGAAQRRLVRAARSVRADRHADRRLDGIYHPALHNDRLLLGLKGTMSEAELHVLRVRLRGGSLHKAGKGELRLPLPAGFDYDDTGRVRITPDEAVADAIATVFAYFEQLQSARQVMLRLLEEGRQLPRKSSADRQVRWVRPATRRSTTSSPTRCSRARTRTGASRPSGACKTAWSASVCAARRARSGTC